MSGLKPETREKLKTVATPTLMTALYKRGLRNQLIQDVHPLNRNAGHGRRGLHPALHAGSRGPEPDRPSSGTASHPQRKAVEIARRARFS